LGRVNSVGYSNVCEVASKRINFYTESIKDLLPMAKSVFQNIGATRKMTGSTFYLRASSFEVKIELCVRLWCWMQDAQLNP
jgi:hypothetical protein